MNKYFVLRKTNRMRTELLTEKSQEQLKEVIRYLRRVSWDFCGIELVRSDLLDIAFEKTDLVWEKVELCLLYTSPSPRD